MIRKFLSRRHRGRELNLTNRILKVLSFYSFLIICAFAFFSCKFDQSPQSKKPVFNMKAVSGSIAIINTFEKYPYPKTIEGYNQAGEELKNPLMKSSQNIQKGRELFKVYCTHCHGESGNSDAVMIKKDKFPPPPLFSIRLPLINEGKMFHSITFGKNQMPGNLYDLNSEQKWQLVVFLETLSPQKDTIQSK